MASTVCQKIKTIRSANKFLPKFLFNVIGRQFLIKRFYHIISEFACCLLKRGLLLKDL